MSGPVPYPESTPPQGFPPFAGAYPGALPPPVQYPKRSPWRVIAAAGVAVAVIAAAAVGAVLVFSGGDDAPVVMNTENVRPAIQGFLDALTDGDDEAIARHALCGLYDAVDDRNSDLALADLSSDAFRKQFTEVEVTSVDKVVPWSTNQAQALFTMTVVEPGTGRGSADAGTEIQVVAQLLQSDDQILVCSYVQRSS
ncbi:hypothetical protein A7U43_13570 [Mycobacterium adipatum]|uniref:DUF8174 domain-containing protein n=1 Tax=Mycobacterium adipatum TaxID=1682113 RepID=A0A172UN75_9MYCO|nr:hypothetical protein [Mycobacterium adipatum]ANE80204.1 hypothetical protein A7U43_13570 [Mycobacterium adipatum]